MCSESGHETFCNCMDPYYLIKLFCVHVLLECLSLRLCYSIQLYEHSRHTSCLFALADEELAVKTRIEQLFAKINEVKVQRTNLYTKLRDQVMTDDITKDVVTSGSANPQVRCYPLFPILNNLPREFCRPPNARLLL